MAAYLGRVDESRCVFEVTLSQVTSKSIRIWEESDENELILGFSRLEFYLQKIKTA